MELKESKENNAKIKALKKIQKTVGKIIWNGNNTHDSIHKCLVGMNLNSDNSGWYIPDAVRIKGLDGIYMINQDGSLFCESRIIKKEESLYAIEYMTSSGWDLFEHHYSEFIEN
jgi:hypothetical protein